MNCDRSFKRDKALRATLDEHCALTEMIQVGAGFSAEQASRIAYQAIRPPRLERHELVRELQRAHNGHGTFQGGNFYDCRGCDLHIMFRGDTLTWKPRRARKEKELRTLDDVRQTVRS